MKKILFYLIVSFMLFNVKAYSQDTNSGPDDLGIWCIIDVDLTDPPTTSGFTEFPFPNPPEEIGVANTIRGEVVIVHQGTIYCHGPGRPYINSELGGCPILCLDLKRLSIDIDLLENEVLVSFPVQKLDMYGSQCYYYIKLVIKR